MQEYVFQIGGLEKDSSDIIPACSRLRGVTSRGGACRAGTEEEGLHGEASIYNTNNISQWTVATTNRAVDKIPPVLIVVEMVHHRTFHLFPTPRYTGGFRLRITANISTEEVLVAVVLLLTTRNSVLISKLSKP